MNITFKKDKRGKQLAANKVELCGDEGLYHHETMTKYTFNWGTSSWYRKDTSCQLKQTRKSGCVVIPKFQAIAVFQIAVILKKVAKKGKLFI